MVKVDYKKLWLMLVERNLTKAQLRKSASLSSATLTKLNKNEFVSMDSPCKDMRRFGLQFGRYR